MNRFFNNSGDAAVWLYVQGFRQDDAGAWSKDGQRATIKTLHDGGVASVAITRAGSLRMVTRRSFGH